MISWMRVHCHFKSLCSKYSKSEICWNFYDQPCSFDSNRHGDSWSTDTGGSSLDYNTDRSLCIPDEERKHARCDRVKRYFRIILFTKWFKMIVFMINFHRNLKNVIEDRMMDLNLHRHWDSHTPRLFPLHRCHISEQIVSKTKYKTKRFNMLGYNIYFVNKFHKSFLKRNIKQNVSTCLDIIYIW